MSFDMSGCYSVAAFLAPDDPMQWIELENLLKIIHRNMSINYIVYVYRDLPAPECCELILCQETRMWREDPLLVIRGVWRPPE